LAPAKTGRLKKAALSVAAAAMAATGTFAPTAYAAQGDSAAPDLVAHGATLTTTFHHPFYDQTQAAFVDAETLRVADTLQTPTGTAVVTGLRLYHAIQTTYDLTIDGLHTYYVVAGTTPVLVHNCVGDSGNGHTDLYHGTSSDSAASIRANGVDTGYSSRPMDFGNGFYTTRNPAQAADWAAKLYGDNGAVLHFRVPNSQLEGLNSLTFSGDSPELRAFVNYYRGGGTGAPYDMVEGPMLGNPGAFMRGTAPRWFGNQVTFFRDTGSMLDAALQ
jgi:hypothetical protein